MSTYLIVDIDVHDTAGFQQYVQLVPEFVSKHGGRYLIRGGNATNKEGDWQPKRVVVLEFPSTPQAEAFLQDPEYAPVAALRHTAASTNMIMVEGQPPADAST